MLDARSGEATDTFSIPACRLTSSFGARRNTAETKIILLELHKTTPWLTGISELVASHPVSKQDSKSTSNLAPLIVLALSILLSAWWTT